MDNRPLAPGEFPFPKQDPWPNDQGPFVRVATICEALLNERTGGISLIRLLNKLVINGNPRFPIWIPVTLYLSMEQFPQDREDHRIQLMIASPLGPRVVNEFVTVSPFGPFREANFDFTLQFPIIEEGKHSVAILYEGRALTKFGIGVELSGEPAGHSHGTPLHTSWEFTPGPKSPPLDQSLEDPGRYGDEESSE